jgi:hypothetical protein
VKTDKNSEAGVLPDEEALNEMLEYMLEDEEGLAKAGAMADDLRGSNAKFRFGRRKWIFIDGPFAETKS